MKRHQAILILSNLFLLTILKATADFKRKKEAKSKIDVLGEIEEISVNRISNCDDCDNLLENDSPLYCTAQHTWVNGSIFLDIPWAIITRIDFAIGEEGLMQTPYFAALATFPNRTGSRQIQIDVCVKEDSCSHCRSMIFERENAMPTNGNVPTKSIGCGQNTQGNQVKVTQLNNLAKFLQPCSLTLHGKCKYRIKQTSFQQDLFILIFSKQCGLDE